MRPTISGVQDGVRITRYPAFCRADTGDRYLCGKVRPLFRPTISPISAPKNSPWSYYPAVACICKINIGKKIEGGEGLDDPLRKHRFLTQHPAAEYHKVWEFEWHDSSFDLGSAQYNFELILPRPSCH